MTVDSETAFKIGEVSYPNVIVLDRYGDDWLAFPRWYGSHQAHRSQAGDSESLDWYNGGTLAEKIMGRGTTPDRALLDMIERMAAEGCVDHHGPWTTELLDEYNGWVR